jgi:elongation factor P
MTPAMAVTTRSTLVAPPSHQQQDTNFKPATLDNGVEVMVPQFVKTGDTIRLDIENLRYMDRAKARRT